MAAIAKSSAQRLQRKSLRSPRRAVGQTRVAGGRCLRVKQNYLGVGTDVVPPNWCFLTPMPLKLLPLLMGSPLPACTTSQSPKPAGGRMDPPVPKIQCPRSAAVQTVFWVVPLVLVCAWPGAGYVLRVYEGCDGDAAGRMRAARRA